MGIVQNDPTTWSRRILLEHFEKVRAKFMDFLHDTLLVGGFNFSEKY